MLKSQDLPSLILRRKSIFQTKLFTFILHLPFLGAHPFVYLARLFGYWCAHHYLKSSHRELTLQDHRIQFSPIRPTLH